MNAAPSSIVLDACGAGELPDAADYGDAGANTLGHVAEAAGGLDLPVLRALGLGSILPLDGVPPAEEPVLHGRLHPLGPGKDTITGHWELMGVVTPVPLRTYPDGFPDEIIEQLHRRDRPRRPAATSPTAAPTVIDDFGEQHLATGDLIVYTSADSVLQIAAHVDEVPPAELYAACAAAREIMTGEHAVGRVIARPFRGEPGAFERTDGPQGPRARRRPAAPTWRSCRPPASRSTRSARSGRCSRASASTSSTRAPPTRRRSPRPTQLIDELDGGFVFTNLVETDQVYGHRGDVPGFHDALQVIDAAVGGWLERLDPERDLLVLTADHGCDPTTPGTDHTREHVPLLARFAGRRRSAATTGRSPTSAPPCCAGWPGGTPRRCPASRSSRESAPLRGAASRRWLLGGCGGGGPSPAKSTPAAAAPAATPSKPGDVEQLEQLMKRRAAALAAGRPRAYAATATRRRSATATARSRATPAALPLRDVVARTSTPPTSSGRAATLKVRRASTASRGVARHVRHRPAASARARTEQGWRVARESSASASAAVGARARAAAALAPHFVVLGAAGLAGRRADDRARGGYARMGDVPEEAAAAPPLPRRGRRRRRRRRAR